MLTNRFYHSLFQLCIDISQSTTYQAFFSFSGHINGISIRICKPIEGDSKLDTLFEYTGYIDGILHRESEFDMVVKVLQYINDKAAIPYGWLSEYTIAGHKPHYIVATSCALPVEKLTNDD